MSNRKPLRWGMVLFILIPLSWWGMVLMAPTISSPRAAWSQGNPEENGAIKDLLEMGKGLIRALGCPVCHDIEGHDTTVQEEAPNLTFEGDKVRPEWVFAFLKEPYRIRHAVRARMPNFRLTDEEALSIVEFLMTLKNKKAQPPPEEFRYGKKQLTPADLKEGGDLFTLYKCRQCHPIEGQLLEGTVETTADKSQLGPDLERVPRRLEPDWVFRWLVDPQVIQEGVNMPSFFYSEGEPIIEGADRQIYALRNYIVNLNDKKNPNAYWEAKKEYPAVTPAMGRSLMLKLNCVGCHNIEIMPNGKKIAPPLNHEGSRVREEWLIEFLKSPRTIKPEFSILGTEARMPGFRLTDEEARALTTYIKTVLVDPDIPTVSAGDGEITPALLEKGEALFYRTYPCVNCHRIGVKAGGIGPILTDAGDRLNVGWVYKFIQNPKYFIPKTRMPMMDVTPEDARAIAAYVLSSRGTINY